MSPHSSAFIHAPISIGELIDKITILEIKCKNLKDQALIHCQKELYLLEQCLNSSNSCVNARLVSELKEVNQSLWDIEDQIREHEMQQDFGAVFVDLARSVYKTNDRRSAIKRMINVECGSAIIEEKSYSEYY